MATCNVQDDSKSGASQFNFVCQRCYQPLKLDPSFYTVEPSVYAELKGLLACAVVFCCFEDVYQLFCIV